MSCGVSVMVVRKVRGAGERWGHMGVIIILCVKCGRRKWARMARWATCVMQTLGFLGPRP